MSEQWGPWQEETRTVRFQTRPWRWWDWPLALYRSRVARQLVVAALMLVGVWLSENRPAVLPSLFMGLWLVFLVRVVWLAFRGKW